MNLTRSLVRANSSAAKSKWPTRTDKSCMEILRLLTRSFRFSVACGDLLLLENGWYVTHTGLLRLARRRRCFGMHVEPATEFSQPSAARWAFKAIVYKSPKCKGFVGYGDADPSNVSFLVHGAEMRVAETRAVNRALRKAYGIGVCSFEEIGSLPESSTSSPQSRKLPPQPLNGNYGARTVRDHFCQIIRQHQLDATLVKSYATDFCGAGCFAKPLASRSKTSSRTWPIGPRKIEMPYCASSTAISARKKVLREALDPRLARGRSICCISNSR
jgi:hypothetical protein